MVGGNLGKYANKSLVKRFLLFVDETGSPGDIGFALGAVLVPASHAPRVDHLIGLLWNSPRELHAAESAKLRILTLLSKVLLGNNDVLAFCFNESPNPSHSRDEAYASALINCTKMALKKGSRYFAPAKLNNVMLILDANQTHVSKSFRIQINDALATDNKFKAVKSVPAIDSKASRLLQLADCVAYIRHLIKTKKLTPQKAEDRYGVSTN